MADAPEDLDAILLVDVGGTSLVDMPKPLAVDDLLRVVLDLARAAAELHGKGVMHRDIGPAEHRDVRNGSPYPVDFEPALPPLAELRPDFTHPTEIVGTLAYLAPAQTGRTGRGADERADVYALGATLLRARYGRAAIRFRRGAQGGRFGSAEPNPRFRVPLIWGQFC